MEYNNWGENVKVQVCTVLSYSLANESHQTDMNRRKDTGYSAQISMQAVAGSSQHRKQSPSFHSHR